MLVQPENAKPDIVCSDAGKDTETKFTCNKNALGPIEAYPIISASQGWLTILELFAEICPAVTNASIVEFTVVCERSPSP